MCICAQECRYPQRPGEGIRSTGAGVIGDCELLGVGAGDQTQVLCKSGHALRAEPPLESVSLLRAWFSGTCNRGICGHASSCHCPYQPGLCPVLLKSLWYQTPHGKDGVSSYSVPSSELLFTVLFSKLCLMK